MFMGLVCSDNRIDWLPKVLIITKILPEVGGGVTEDLELPSNEEQAIVLFKPVNQ